MIRMLVLAVALAPTLAFADLSGAPGKGVTLEVDDTFSLNLRSRVQVREQFHVPAEGDTDNVLTVGTLRLWLSGKLLVPELTYGIQLGLAGRDYRDGATSPVYDAYLDYKAHRDLAIRAGQFFVPFDRLRTVREFALQLADRPRPVGELTLDRDTGVMLYSDGVFGSPLAYKVGVFGGAGTNSVAGKPTGALAVARLELRPFGPIDDDSEGDLARRDELGLALGAAVAYNANTNRVRSTTNGTFAGGTVDYRHLAVDLVAKWYGAALQLEYLWREAGTDLVAMDEYSRSGRGFIAQASYVFDPPVEIVGRFSRLYASSGTDPKLISEVKAYGQELAAGVNYYFNGHALKLQADWIVRTARKATLEEGDHLVHVQLDAVF
jgi:hypothetical protein